MDGPPGSLSLNEWLGMPSLWVGCEPPAGERATGAKGRGAAVDAEVVVAVAEAEEVAAVEVAVDVEVEVGAEAEHGMATAVALARGGEMVDRRASVQIAVASGKGGTGKTTVSTNLAFALQKTGREVTYLDCDVEAPNGHIFLKPDIGSTEPVGLPVPVVDEEACTSCGNCSEICQYGAIIQMGSRVITFPDLCHGCGGCALVCPEHAITEEARPIGVVEQGEAGGIRFLHGRLNVGCPLSPPLIRATKARLPDRGVLILDAPPGTSCPAVQAVKDSDYVVLVAEPTPFGLNDLGLTVDMVRALGLDLGVVINRSNGNGDVRRYCEGEGIEVLMEIDDDRRVAESYSRGELACEAVPGYQAAFTELAEKVRERAAT